MRRIQVCFFLLLLIFSWSSLSAQDANIEDIPDDYPPEWVEIISAPYSAGDRSFIITIGTLLPVFFTGLEDGNHGLSIGGTGFLALNYYLSENVYVGGEISGMFASTRGRNMLYIIPFGGRIGYQMWYQRFEFPINLTIGAATQRYLGKSHFGLFFKPGASMFWRYNADWSFGANASWWIVPEWPRNGKNVMGNFIELSLSARYHF